MLRPEASSSTISTDCMLSVCCRSIIGALSRRWTCEGDRRHNWRRWQRGRDQWSSGEGGGSEGRGRVAGDRAAERRGGPVTATGGFRDVGRTTTAAVISPCGG